MCLTILQSLSLSFLGPILNTICSNSLSNPLTLVYNIMNQHIWLIMLAICFSAKINFPTISLVSPYESIELKRKNI